MSLGAAKQRALLALLLLNRGTPVSVDILIEELWAGAPPARAAKSVQVYISNLRKVLGPELVLTRGQSYLLAVEDEAVDVARFERLLEEGRLALAADRPTEAAATLREALGLWRGPPLGDLAYESFAQNELSRLEELRLSAVEERLEADLALGRARESVAELESLVRDHPLRERLRGQLMLALYRSGRQAEALDAYRHGRHQLVEQLGLEPGPELQELEWAILAQDPKLGPSRRPQVLRERSRRRILLAGLALMLAAGAAAAAIELTGGSATHGLPPLAANAVAAFDPKTGRFIETVRVPIEPDRLAVHGSSAWVGDSEDRTVVEVQAGHDRPSRVVPTGMPVSGLAAGRQTVWAVARSSGKLERIDSGYGTVKAAARVQPPSSFFVDLPVRDPWTVAEGNGIAWVTDGSTRLVRVDAATDALRRFDVGVPVNAVTVDAGAVWAVSGRTATVVRVSAETGAVTLRVPIVDRPRLDSPYPTSVAVGEGFVWVLNANTATVTKIDPRQRGIVQTIPLGIDRDPRRLAVGAGAVWIADGDGTLARIDPATGAVAVIPVGRELLDVAVSSEVVWLATGPARALARETTTDVTRVRPLTTPSCSPIFYQGQGQPRYLIAADLSLQGPASFVSKSILGAITLVLEQRAFRAGPYGIGFQVCDDTPPSGPAYPAPEKCAANARAMARDPSVVGTLGAPSSYCAQSALPVLNRAPGGPLGTVNATNTYVGLTRHGPETARDEPQRYFPTGRRSYVRIVAADDYQGTAVDFTRAAHKLGIAIVGSGRWVEKAGNYHALAARIAGDGAQAIFIGGSLQDNGATLIRDLRAGLGPSVSLIANDGFTPVSDTIAVVGSAAEGLTVSAADTPIERLPPAGRRFVTAYRRAAGEEPSGFAIYAAQATDVLLDAIARSDGTRASVIRELFRTKVSGGILGSFSIGPTGDTTQNSVTITQVRQGRPVTLAVIVPSAKLVGS